MPAQLGGLESFAAHGLHGIPEDRLYVSDFNRHGSFDSAQRAGPASSLPTRPRVAQDQDPVSARPHHALAVHFLQRWRSPLSVPEEITDSPDPKSLPILGGAGIADEHDSRASQRRGDLGAD